MGETKHGRGVVKHNTAQHNSRFAAERREKKRGKRLLNL